MEEVKWNHIMDRQPDHGESIIQIDPPFQGHYTMVQTTYYQRIPFHEYLDWAKENNISYPDFWWISAKDFPFPDNEEVFKK